MVGQFHFLRRLGIPGSAVTVLSQLSHGEKTTAEMSKNSGLSKSAILSGIKYWQQFGVARRHDTNKWQLNELDYVQEMVATLKDEESELISSIEIIDGLIVDV